MDSKIVDTVMALDVAFGELLRNVRDQLPGLSMLLREALVSASTSRADGLPDGAKQRLSEYAALLTRPPSA